MTEIELEPQQKTLWLKGVSAYQIKNLDYAIDLILAVVKHSPDFLEGRKTLRLVEIEKVRTTKKSMFGGGLNLGGFKLTSNAKKEPWEGIAELEESVFKKDPFNATANQALYDYAMRMAKYDLAAFALETLKEGTPDNTKNLHKLAEHYMAFDEPEKAGTIYSLIRKIDPKDGDANKGEKDAAAKTSMLRQGWEGGNLRGAMKNPDETANFENMTRQGMTPEQMDDLLGQLAIEYQRDNSNLAVVKKIADVYERKGENASALGYYEWATQLSPGDISLKARVEQLRNKIAEIRIQQMVAEIEANPDAPDIEEKREQIRAIKLERLSTLLAEARAKVERNPTDKQYRYDLATVLFEAEQYREAIPELQQAKSNPHIRNKSLLMLGRCFERLNMNDLAQNVMCDAVKESPTFNNEKKELLYELGLVYEKTDKKEEYLSCMKEIYNSDYGYRDVAKRVEASYG